MGLDENVVEELDLNEFYSGDSAGFSVAIEVPLGLRYGTEDKIAADVMDLFHAQSWKLSVHTFAVLEGGCSNFPFLHLVILWTHPTFWKEE